LQIPDMQVSKLQIKEAATVFQVADLGASLRFYCDVLGFAVDFTYEAYAGIHLGGLYLHLCAHETWKRPIGGGALMAFCSEVDAYYELVKSRDARIRLAPTDEPYGMRDFALSDPDGNVLTFGCELPNRELAT
jgi:catechol 2,3-dioxygenase-like lactoylglutathione lyase family enzyme